MSSYVVRRVSPRMMVKPVVAVTYLAGGMVVSDPPRFIVVIFVVGVIASFAWLVPTTSTRLRISSRGITLGPGKSSEEQVQVPWSSVREVVVVTGPEAVARVGVRLHPGAPLPAGVRGLVHDPADPDRVQIALTRKVPGLNRGALDAAVECYGVRVVAVTES